MFLACLISSIVLPITMPMILRRIPKFYDPLYYPDFYPEVFLNSHTVKDWLDSFLSSRVLYCKICVPSSSVANIKISVLWKNVSYMVCLYLDGKIRQCLLSLEDLQSCRYSHCGLVSRLQRKVLSSTKAKPTPFLSPPSTLSHILDKEQVPAWLFYTV